MKLIYRFVVLIGCLTIIGGFCSFEFYGEENTYDVCEAGNGKKEVIESFASYYEAYSFYNNNVDGYSNLVLYENDKAILMEYGVVCFKNNDEQTLNISYESLPNNSETIINSSFGADGAYLYSLNDCNKVCFKISGDIGIVDIEDVELLPYELLNTRLSVYRNINGDFCHLIMNQMKYDFYNEVLKIDRALSYLENDTDYYSYDGHYFYDDFHLMIDDYINENYENAINFENPYYNYYQYLPYRSFTNYETKDLENYFYDKLKINDKIYHYVDQAQDGANDVVNRSQYYGEVQNFFAYEGMYGANGMMLLATSMNESHNGKSLDSVKYNRVFSYSAFNSDYERDNQKNETIGDSIGSYAKYFVSDRFANHRNDYYSGLYFGNKLSGINSYDSYDPYWGERNASNYYVFDSFNGFKDYQKYALAIFNELDDKLIIYRDDTLSTKDYSFYIPNDYSLVVLKEYDNAYMVQLDQSFNSNYVYNFNNRIGYVSKEDVKLLINIDNIHENDLIRIKFNGNGGAYDDLGSVDVYILKGKKPIMFEPKYDGYDFVGYDKEYTNANKEQEYEASYKKISNMFFNGKIDAKVVNGESFDLNNKKLIINYEDGSQKVLPLTEGMLFGIDYSKDGEQTIQIIHSGFSIDITIDVSNKYNNMSKETIDLSKKILNDRNCELRDANLYINNTRNLGYVNSLNTLRIVDEYKLNENRDEYDFCIKDNTKDISISGLSFGLPDTNSIFKLLPFTNTYYLHVTKASINNVSKLEKIGKAYDFNLADSFRIYYSINMKTIEQIAPTIISIKLDNKQANKIYSVYRIDDNGDIVKCKTEHTNNYIKFLTQKSGDFVVLEKDSVNNYEFEDYYENLSLLNSDVDDQKLFVTGVVIMGIIVVGFMIIVFNSIIEENDRKLWRDYKKLLQQAEFAQEEKQSN